MRLSANAPKKTEGLSAPDIATLNTTLAAPGGVLLLDKPTGMTSSAAVQKVRRLFSRVKAGHTGTLDPLASGLLPVCLGEATKFSHPLLEARKSYRATLRLGWRSTTGDAEGELVEVGTPDFTQEQLREAVSALTGQIEQVPPMYSAVKVGGRPLYSLARKGVSVERAARSVNIYALQVLNASADSLEIFVCCSKGTYIRVLGEELGALLGCGAYLTALRRVGIGRLDVAEAVGFDVIESASTADRLAMLRPLDLLIGELPEVRLGPLERKRLCNGLAVPGHDTIAPVARVRLYDEDGRFLGLGEVDQAGVLRPKRLLSSCS
jgi:tRNA pseudouridine55 synthase